MGRSRKRQLANAGGVVEKPTKPIDVQMNEASIVKSKRVRINTDGEDDEKINNQLGPKRLSSILKQAQRQKNEADSDDDGLEDLEKLNLNKKGFYEDDLPDDDNEETVVYDPSEFKVDEKDERDFDKFLGLSGQRTIYDLIMEKIEQRKNAHLFPSDAPTSSFPPEAVTLYTELGKILSRYRSGKVPLAFKNIALLNNWEEALELTCPDSWSSAAMLYATRMFTSTQKPARVQQFLSTILLPRIRDEIVAHKKLNTHLYHALYQATTKPAAFYKGIVLPLAESGNCTLTESVVVGSVILKKHIPPIHSCAAMFKLASVNGTNFASGLYFLQILVRKRYALPYQVIDKMVEYFAQTASSNESLPLLWHRTFWLFVESYANDLSGDQITLLSLLTKEKQHHYYYSSEILHRLREAEQKLEKEGNTRME
uniref:Bystin n=1 Tax=Panagrolaimus sp. JU765 TaxID=591449 RepID=A0AC34QEP1_9BILA